MIRNSEVRRARQWARRADVSQDLANVLSPDGRGTPSRLSVETALTGTLLACWHAPAMTYENIHRVLTQRISVEMQRELGVRYRDKHGTERTITRRPIENMFNQIGDRLGFLPGSHPDLEEGLRLQRGQLLQSVIDRLVDASKPIDLAPTGDYALDATGLWSWARSGDDSLDRDAQWGYKTAKNGEKEMFFGYDLYAFARVQKVGDTAPYPHVVERCVLWPASSDEPDSTLPLIKCMLAEGYPINTLIVDRAWSYKLPERWAFPIRELGIEQVVDLHKNDHGVRDYNGMRVVAGSPHCPCLPDELVDITRPQHLKLPDGTDLDTLPSADDDKPESETERQTREFVTRIEARRAYACRRVAGPDRKGKERYECPAAAGQVRCPLKDLSMHLPAGQVPTIENPPDPDGAPQICTQRTVTLPGSVTPKVRQRYYWGSVEWIRSFARRTHIEGVFGNLKNRNTENVTRGWIQVAGHARTALMLAIVTAAYNLRVARKWNAEAGSSKDPLLQPDPEFYGWREIDFSHFDEYLDDGTEAA